MSDISTDSADAPQSGEAILQARIANLEAVAKALQGKLDELAGRFEAHAAVLKASADAQARAAGVELSAIPRYVARRPFQHAGALRSNGEVFDWPGPPNEHMEAVNEAARAAVARIAASRGR